MRWKLTLVFEGRMVNSGCEVSGVHDVMSRDHELVLIIWDIFLSRL